MSATAYPQGDEVGRSPATLPDVLDRILDKGLVVAGDVTLQLLDVEILTVKVRLLLCSAERAEEMGIDWWKHDPFLSGQAKQDRELDRRIQKIEQLLDSVASSESGRDAGTGGEQSGDHEREASEHGGKPERESRR